MNTAAENAAEQLDHPNVWAMLAVIRGCEHADLGWRDVRVYRRQVGGKIFPPRTFLGPKPRDIIEIPRRNAPSLWSSAWGAYQFINRTWDACATALGLTTCDPYSQDLAAVHLLSRRGALDALLAGNLDAAVYACRAEWASLPGSPYGQPVHPIGYCRAIFLAAGGRLAGTNPA